MILKILENKLIGNTNFTIRGNDFKIFQKNHSAK
jgi:hypothetical protein